MAAISSIIAGVAAGIAAAGTSYAIVSGQESAARQKQALGEQRRAQQAQAAQAMSQQRRSQQAMAAANRQEPDVSQIMQGAAAEGGPSATMLTGPMGVNPQQLQLGRSTLLGG